MIRGNLDIIWSQMNKKRVVPNQEMPCNDGRVEGLLGSLTTPSPKAQCQLWNYGYRWLLAGTCPSTAEGHMTSPGWSMTGDRVI